MKRKNSLDFTLSEEQEVLRVTCREFAEQVIKPLQFFLFWLLMQRLSFIKNLKGEPHG
jgi:hypothetical protein